ncbi:hypothetical protein E4U43_005937 [Claviceps pusilla]|uniref:Uncharacterized protein n=1 Tax=Claviceps pusilla TaxID=123648 RepID=A0A9P7ST25_9HYPO|nr:hypothetical protein E4U43_005937 [Claviceps pusilla]
MAWLTQESPDTFNQNPEEPDLKTLIYWISRLEPLIRADSNEEFIVIFANRCGSENEATYSGTSAVVGIASGEVRVYGILGRGQSDLLVVDTCQPPFAKLVYLPEGGEDVPTEEAVGAGDDRDVMNGASSHDDARTRDEEQESQDASPRKHEVQPTTTDASALRHDESDGWSVSSERRLPAPSAADEIITAVNSLGIDDQEAHTPHTPHTPNHGRPPTDTRWMADDDSELAHVEGDDAQQPFHDPTGIIGQWVQMTQTPQDAPARPQHHQEHVGVLANGYSHTTHDDRESSDIFFSPVESEPPELSPSMSIHRRRHGHPADVPDQSKPPSDSQGRRRHHQAQLTGSLDTSDTHRRGIQSHTHRDSPTEHTLLHYGYSSQTSPTRRRPRANNSAAEDPPYQLMQHDPSTSYPGHGFGAQNQFLQGEHEIHGRRMARSSLRIDSSMTERGWVAQGKRFQQDPKTPVAMVLTSR